MTPDATTGLALVPFRAEHLPGAQALSAAAGWPHRAEDWALTLSVSHGVVALHAGRVVGTALCSVFGPVAALNMIIVDAAMRGRGLGRTLMAAIIDLAGAREMRLTATEAGLPLYRKLGFAEVGQIVQHQGVALAAVPERPVRSGGADIAALAQADTAASGMDRAALITRIAATGEVLRCDGGFALLRAFGRGHVLGPVVAQDATAARALMAAAATGLAGQFLRIDLPAERGLSGFAETLGLARVGGGTAMVRSPHPPRPPSPYHTFALASQALG
jgi:GNAT superfamily N-acetyltransferase